MVSKLDAPNFMHIVLNNGAHESVGGQPSAGHKTTVQSMQSGAVRGYVGALTGIITDIQKELGGKARVVATGGMGRMMAEYCDLIDDVDPNLTLEGLRLIYENNREAFENRKLDMNNSVIEVTEEGAWQENK